MNSVTHEILLKRASQLGNLPAMPKVLRTLNEELSVPVGQVNLDKLVRTISYDKSLAAQCLRMANSALYRQRGDVNTVSEAVLTLGILRIRDLVFSCSLPRIFTTLNGVVPKEVFWRHALATALVLQKLAEEFAALAHENIYIAGLLHDIGILINALLFPEDFHEVMKQAVTEQSSILSAELRVLGFTHAESGRVLADAWKLPLEVSETIEFHHAPDRQTSDGEATRIVHVADQLCLSSDMGYGYELQEGEISSLDQVCCALADKFPRAQRLTPQAFATLVQSTLASARELADRVFGPLPR